MSIPPRASIPGNRIPAERISPQAAALLALYPQPNVEGDGRYNYQATTVTATNVDTFQSRINHNLGNRDALLATASYQRTASDATSLFGFTDASAASNLDTAITWSHRFNQFFTLRTGYQLVRQDTDSTPHFANLTNVSGGAGISGNNQEPVNWGPPSLLFSDGMRVTTGQFARRYESLGSP